MDGPNLRKCSLALSVMFLGFTGALDAQQIPSPYRYLERSQEAGPFIAYLDPDPGQFELGPRKSVAYGARYGLEISGPFGLEGAVAYSPSTRDVINPRLAAGNRKVGEADMTLLLIDVRLRFGLTGRRTWHRLAPYVVAGGGMGFDLAGDQVGDAANASADRFELGTTFLGTLGTGVRVALSERLFARGDIQLTLWQLDTPEGFQDPELDFESVPNNQWVSNRVFSVGLSYRF